MWCPNIRKKYNVVGKSKEIDAPAVNWIEHWSLFLMEIVKLWFGISNFINLSTTIWAFGCTLATVIASTIVSSSKIPKRISNGKSKRFIELSIELDIGSSLVEVWEIWKNWFFIFKKKVLRTFLKPQRFVLIEFFFKSTFFFNSEFFFSIQIFC